MSSWVSKNTSLIFLFLFFFFFFFFHLQRIWQFIKLAVLPLWSDDKRPFIMAWELLWLKGKNRNSFLSFQKEKHEDDTKA